MARMKKLLDVVHDLYQLSDSLKELAQAMDGSEQAAAPPDVRPLPPNVRPLFPLPKFRKKANCGKRPEIPRISLRRARTYRNPRKPKKRNRRANWRRQPRRGTKANRVSPATAALGPLIAPMLPRLLKRRQLIWLRFAQRWQCTLTRKTVPGFGMCWPALARPSSTELREEQYAAMLKEVESVCRT